VASADDPARFDRAAVAKRLDHAVLKPTLGDGDLAAAARMCLARGVGCLCVRSCDVAEAARLLRGGSVAVASVVGFPHGNVRPEVKALEASLAIEDGAVEIDMVMNIPAFLSGRHVDVARDIRAVVEAAGRSGGIVKVILETCLLSLDEIATACRIAEESGADFVKTSTGFASGGATHEAVAVMLQSVGSRLGVKASGGIRTWGDCVAYLEQGCSRIGVGDAAAILDGAGS
jgi:deoxyribose-phosphate aldolase